MYLKSKKGSFEGDVMFLVGYFWLHPQIPGDWTCDHTTVCHVGTAVGKQEQCYLMEIEKCLACSRQSANGSSCYDSSSVLPVEMGSQR